MPSSHEPPLQNAAFIASFILMTEALSAVIPNRRQNGAAAMSSIGACTDMRTLWRTAL